MPSDMSEGCCPHLSHHFVSLSCVQTLHTALAGGSSLAPPPQALPGGYAPPILLRRKLSPSKCPQATAIKELQQAPGTMGGRPGHLQSAKHRTRGQLIDFVSIVVAECQPTNHTASSREPE